MNGLLAEEPLDHEHEARIAKALRVQWIVWVIVTSSSVVFVILCHALSGRFSQRVIEPSVLGIFRTVFIIVGCIDLILSFVLRRYLFSPLFRNFSAPTREQDTGRREPVYLVQHRLKTMIPTGMASTVGFLGFVLYTQGDSLGVFYAFVVFSLLGCLYHRPKRREVVELCKAFLRDQQSASSGEEGSS